MAMTLYIKGQLVNRIVVHGDEVTIWEPPTGGGGFGSFARLLDELRVIDVPIADTIDPLGTEVTESVSLSDGTNVYSSFTGNGEGFTVTASLAGAVMDYADATVTESISLADTSAGTAA